MQSLELKKIFGFEEFDPFYKLNMHTKKIKLKSCKRSQNGMICIKMDKYDDKMHYNDIINVFNGKIKHLF